MQDLVFFTLLHPYTSKDSVLMCVLTVIYEIKNKTERGLLGTCRDSLDQGRDCVWLQAAWPQTEG